MAKRIMIEGVPHRMRRGKLVVIPEEWVGKVTDPQTQRKRASHTSGGQQTKNLSPERLRKRTGHGSDKGLYKGLAQAPTQTEWEIEGPLVLQIPHDAQYTHPYDV